MTDPVVPTQPAGGQAFPPPNSGEAPVPVQPVDPPKKKSSFGKKLLGILGGLLVIVVIGVLKGGFGSMLAGDPTGDAKAGDCLAIKSDMGETASRVEAELTGCSSADAKYTVLGRVDGVKDVQSKACDQTFDAKLEEGEEGYVIASEEGKGYLLCLKGNG